MLQQTEWEKEVAILGKGDEMSVLEEKGFKNRVQKIAASSQYKPKAVCESFV